MLQSAPLTDFDLGPVSGSLRLGSLEWALDAGSIYSYSYQGTPGLTPASAHSLSAGFGYPVQNGTFYSYAMLGGDFRAWREDVQVPEPATLLLMSFGLLALWCARTRGMQLGT